jgi:hypothetical protein
MVCPPLPPSPIVANWVERHRGAVTFSLHMIGIPLTILGVLMLPIAAPALSWRILVLSLALFVGGYAFQFLGHALEATEPGEITALRAWLNRPRLPRTAPEASRQGIA